MIEENVYTTLSGFTGLTDLVGTNIFHGEVEPGILLPYVSFYSFSDAPENTVDGFNGTTNTQIQVDVYANDATQARNIAQQVRLAFDAATLFKSVRGAKRGPIRIEPGYQRCQVEFSTWHN